MDFGSDSLIKAKTKKVTNTFTFNQNLVEEIINELGFEINAHKFIEFIKNAFEQREFFKFEFTKSLSLAIEMIRKLGNELGFKPEDLSYLELSDILASKHYLTLHEVKTFWLSIINSRKKDYHSNSKLVLPEVIQSADDIDAVFISESRPNFITTKIVIAQTVNLEDNLEADINGKIVLITKADPGFDWIFTKQINGLVTKYGGVASHMAIRCAEFGIPAAIGCGEIIYKYAKEQDSLELDCKNGKIL